MAGGKHTERSEVEPISRGAVQSHAQGNASFNKRSRQLNIISSVSHGTRHTVCLIQTESPWSHII